MVDMTRQSDVLNILMLGEALDRPGGVVTVEKATLQLASPALRFRHIPTLPKDGSFGAFRKFCMALSAFVRLPFRLLVERVDVVHIHVSQGASVYRKMLLAWIAFLFGKPLVFHTHGGDVAKRFPGLPSPLRRLIAWTYRRADTVIALGESWRQFYIEAMGVDPDRVVILRNPVSMPATIPARAEPPSLKLLYLGMLSEPKGAFDLIRAVSTIPKETRDQLNLIMAGHGEVEHARRMVDELGLGDTVTIPGWIGPAERDALFEEVHGLVLPSHFEGMPMSLLEAMSWGLAVIATPVGAIPDVVIDGKNGFLVPVSDANALSAAMMRLIEDPALCRKFGAEGRKTVEPFSMEGYAEHLISLYSGLKTNQKLAEAS